MNVVDLPFTVGPERLRVTTLASGSGGNATLFEARDTRVLVDGGIAPRALELALHETRAGGLPDAIIVTHAHQDHVGHTARLAKRYGIPVYMTRATERAAAMPASVEVIRFHPRAPFVLGALTVSPTAVPHDAAQVALVISDGESRAAIVTDLGEITGQLEEHLRGCDVVLIESNHELDLLERGPYPWFLKARVRSARGHLSNAQACELLARLGAEAHTIVLMHLSQTNNREDLAIERARDALGRRRLGTTRLLTAPPRSSLVIDATTRACGRARQLALFA